MDNVKILAPAWQRTDDPVLRARAVKVALYRYWRSVGATTDVHFYYPEQWQARREPYGNDALLSVTFEGELYSHMNDGDAVSEETWRICEEHGLGYELGYAWSMHLYWRDGGQEASRARAWMDSNSGQS